MRTWGGKRRGAGRPCKPGRRSVPHRRRAQHVARCPAHVTLRAATGIPSLRAAQIVNAIQNALRVASNDRFRVLEFSHNGTTGSDSH